MTSRACAALRLPPLPTIRDLVKLYQLKAQRQLSQNFLLDSRLTDKIVRSAGKLAEAYVCEVGPGPGGITRSIIRRGPKHLLTVEKDPRFIPTLELLGEACGNSIKFQPVIDDILTFNLENAFPEAPRLPWTSPPPPVHLIGNLPFSISTHLIIQWLYAVSEKRSAWIHGRTQMTLTFQKEVAERIVAPIMHKQRCRLSVMCQMWCRANHKFNIPGTAFTPKPDVDVGIVTLRPLIQPLTDLPFKFVERIVRTVFNMRGKYCIRGVKNLFPTELQDELVPKVFDLADLDPHTRPYQISNEEFARLCLAFKVLYDEYPELEKYDYRQPKILRNAVT